ncbi:MAG: hypothetical protein ABIO36_06330 [Pyrinomonadaceae bacterium]
MPPIINDLLVYTPAEDFEISKRFYSALGFEMTEGWGGTMDCRLGGAFLAPKLLRQRLGGEFYDALWR